MTSQMHVLGMLPLIKHPESKALLNITRVLGYGSTATVVEACANPLDDMYVMHTFVIPTQC